MGKDRNQLGPRAWLGGWAGVQAGASCRGRSRGATPELGGAALKTALWYMSLKLGQPHRERHPED